MPDVSSYERLVADNAALRVESAELRAEIAVLRAEVVQVGELKTLVHFSEKVWVARR